MSLHVEIEKPRRWSVPFGEGMTDEVVGHILDVRPFRNMNPDNFPDRTSLRDIIKHDTSLRRAVPGEIVVRAGDYGNSAFFVLSGCVRSLTKPGLTADQLGRADDASRKKGALGTLVQLLTNNKESEVRSPDRYAAADQNLVGKQGDAHARVVLPDVSGMLNDQQTARLVAGSFFGEGVALGRMAWPTSVVVEEEGTVILEIRWQGIRELMKYDEALRNHIQELYRQRILQRVLRRVPSFSALPDQTILKLAEETEFLTFGEYEWSGTYQALISSGDYDAKKLEPVIIEEGHHPNGVYILASGFARQAAKYANGRETINYLRAGDSYGFDEAIQNWKSPDEMTGYTHSLRALGYAHVLFIPSPIIESLVLPNLAPDLVETALQSVAKITAGREVAPWEQDKKSPEKLDAAFVEFLGENRFMNGRATMLIQLDRCTRCDDCVRACSATHDNNPRFLRHGPVQDNIMVAHACMHCSDPVCMIGCPTGAIHRSVQGGQVVINDLTCIGCGACAANCPYEAIRLVPIRTKVGEPILSTDGTTPIIKATKCDLCADQAGGPACERACPHDALRRVDMEKLPDYLKWLDL